MVSFNRQSIPSFLCLAAASLFLTACGGSTPDDTYAEPQDSEATTAAIDLAPAAPPALSDEAKPVINTRTQVWRPGHWIYQDRRFVWVPGEIITRPSPTAVWSQDRWEHRQYGWAFISGYWQ